MSKLIILQGPPCSGKSTWAAEYKRQDDPEVIIVNRNDIRLEINNGKYTMEREDEVTEIEYYRVINGLKDGKTVILDATNLNPIYLKKWLRLPIEYTYEFKEFYVPYAEAMRRSKARRDSGGLYINRNVMTRFYKKYYPKEFREELTDRRVIREPEVRLPSVVICDLDVTLALHQGREPFEWDLLKTDKIDPRLRLLLNNFMGLYKVLFVTGRPESTRLATTEWLQDPENKLHSNWELFMRKNNDFSHGDDYKEKVYRENIEGKYNVLCVFEDSNKCVTRWRELGLLTCQVENSDY